MARSDVEHSVRPAQNGLADFNASHSRALSGKSCGRMDTVMVFAFSVSMG
ncbi:hypothetical protein ACH4VT_02930 [Streptomyces lydicus]